jgi:tetratricopeptide (TPR) repeat protein
MRPREQNRRMKRSVPALAFAIGVIGFGSSAFAFSAFGVKAVLLNCLNKSLSSSERIEACNQAIQSNEFARPDRARLITSRGNAYFASGDLDRALDDYNKAIELDPQLPEAVANRAVTLIRFGKCAQAASDLNAMLEADDHSWRALYGRSICEGKQGDREKEQLDLSAATAVNPNAAEDFVPVEIQPWFQ